MAIIILKVVYATIFWALNILLCNPNPNTELTICLSKLNHLSF